MNKWNMGLMAGAVAGVMVLGVVGAMLGNTKQRRRRRFMKKMLKTAHNIGCAMQSIASF